MLVHRLKGATAAHAAFAGLRFKVTPRRNPPEPDDELKTAAVAEQLGVTRTDVRDLVHAELLPADRDGRGNIVVIARDLDRFIAKRLEPVEVVEVDQLDHGAGDAAAAGTTSDPPPEDQPRLANPPAESTSTTPDEPATRPRLMPVDEAAAEDDGIAFVSPCPRCETPLAIQKGVLAVRCPSCRHRLDVVSQEEPGDEDRGGVGGIRLFGFRVGRRRAQP